MLVSHEAATMNESVFRSIQTVIFVDYKDYKIDYERC